MGGVGLNGGGGLGRWSPRHSPVPKAICPREVASPRAQVPPPQGHTTSNKARTFGSLAAFALLTYSSRLRASISRASVYTANWSLLDSKSTLGSARTCSKIVFVASNMEDVPYRTKRHAAGAQSTRGTRVTRIDGYRGRFRTARAQRGHSANYYGDYPGNNPENHPTCGIMHNQFKTQKFQHLMLAMGPRDLNSAPYSPVHCSSHSMTSFQSSELTELSVMENSQLFAQRVHSARYAPIAPPPPPAEPPPPPMTK